MSLELQNTFKGKTLLITGGTGSLGKALIARLLADFDLAKIIVFSRDELKQAEMRESFRHQKLAFLLGDVRDLSRLEYALRNVNFVIHAAALKRVDSIELNPSEAIKTNVMGAMNVIDAARRNSVQHVVALSTDKACNPVNLYGASKLCSDKLFIAANSANSGSQGTLFNVVRYGNVFTSRGSVVPFFVSKHLSGEKVLPITDASMTRFSLTLEYAVDLVLKSFKWGFGGELFVAKTPSYKIMDLAKAVDEHATFKFIGIRPGEKLHEIMIASDESGETLEFEDYFAVIPPFSWYKHRDQLIARGARTVASNFTYKSNENDRYLTVEELKKQVDEYISEIKK